jgi:hypothetical protein
MRRQRASDGRKLSRSYSDPQQKQTNEGVWGTNGGAKILRPAHYGSSLFSVECAAASPEGERE